VRRDRSATEPETIAAEIEQKVHWKTQKAKLSDRTTKPYKQSSKKKEESEEIRKERKPTREWKRTWVVLA